MGKPSFNTTPEEQAAIAAYYGSDPRITPAAAPPPSSDPAAYYGPAPSAPIQDAGAPPMVGGAPPPPPPPPPPQMAAPQGPPQGPPPAPIPSGPEPGGPPADAPAVPYGKVDTSNYWGPKPAPKPTGFEGPDPIAAFEAGTNGGTLSTREPTSFTRTRPGLAKTTGGGPGQGDFGVGAARKAIRGSFDEEKKDIQLQADTEKDRADLMAHGGLDLAHQRQQDAAAQQAEAQHAADAFRDYQEETQRQVDAVKSKQIDPNRLYSTTGDKLMGVFGAIMGGMYMGLNHLDHNPAIDQMNKKIDRDIAVQEKNLANERANISERRSLLGDMRATYKDENLAKLQAKNLYYEGAKEELAAQAATYDNPAVQARANLAITAIGREQAKLDLDTAMRRAAQAQAAGAAQLAAQERARKAELDERKMRVEEGELLVKADADRGTRAKKDADEFVVTGNDPATGAPLGFKAQSPEQAAKLTDALTASDELLQNVQRARAIRAEQGYTGRAGSKLVPFNTKAENDLESLEKEIGVGWSRAKPGMGTYDNGIERLTSGIVGNLTGVGGQADDKLAELERRVTSARATMLKHHAGAEGVKEVDDSGKERVVPTGRISSAPNNPRTAQRFDLDGNPIK